MSEKYHTLGNLTCPYCHQDLVIESSLNFKQKIPQKDDAALLSCPNQCDFALCVKLISFWKKKRLNLRFIYEKGEFLSQDRINALVK